MLKKSLTASAAAAALVAFGFAASAQSQRGVEGGASSPAQSQGQSAPGARGSGSSTGVAPGLEGRTDAPRATPGNERAQERTGTGAGETTTTQTQPRSGDAARGQTTGQVPQVQLSSQQRTELRQQFQRANIRTVTRDRINVSITVGSVLPATVEFVPIPASVLAIVPQFRGYEVVRVGDEILIVEPGTRRIVYIIEA